MKVFLSIILLLIFASHSSCQSDTTFFDKEFKVCKRSQAAYYRLIYSQGNNLLVKDMYISNRPLTIVTCSSVKPKLIYEGKYIHYYNESGLTFVEGNYHDNEEYGRWMYVKDGKDTTYYNRGITIGFDPRYHHTLYVGIDNPITLSAVGVQSENLRVTTTGSTIEGRDGNYIVRANKEGHDTFRVFNRDVYVGEEVASWVKIPAPVAFLGNSSGDCRTKREDAVSAGCLTVKTPGYEVDPGYEIVSFIFSFNKGGVFYEKLSTGPCLTDFMKDFILHRTNSNIVFIEQVTAIGPDGKKRRIPGINLRFDLDDANVGLESEKQKVNEEAAKIIARELKIKTQEDKIKEQQLILNRQDSLMQERKKEIVRQEGILSAQLVEIRNKTNILWIAAGVILVILALMIFSVRSYIQKRRDNRVINEQKQLVERKNKEITDSIEYALRIQTAILPPRKMVNRYLEQAFVLYLPKDIVAGDFYWMETVNDLVLFAACDCTGHGVPGAMVSVICHNALNRAVREFGLILPAMILDKTAEIVVEHFSKSEENIKDGMDISLCALDRKRRVLQWAGANNPLWLIRNEELIETKADKQPIGKNENSRPFTNHQFLLEPNDTIYLFTDGFADQFGGEKGTKKLTRKRFRELLVSMQDKPMQEQGETLKMFIGNYRKEVEQIDDILVIGVSIE